MAKLKMQLSPLSLPHFIQNFWQKVDIINLNWIDPMVINKLSTISVAYHIIRQRFNRSVGYILFFDFFTVR